MFCIGRWPGAQKVRYTAREIDTTLLLLLRRLRIAAIGCVLVAIAGPMTPSAVAGHAAIFVVDRSGSIPPERDHRAGPLHH